MAGTHQARWPERSAVRRLVRAVAAEYVGDTFPARIGSWIMLESWLLNEPPTSINDLYGDRGIELKPVEMPALLREALAKDAENEKNQGGKIYYS
jgi:hypothetical protein